MVKPLLLQCKFILVEWLSISYGLIPNPLRKYYLRCFSINVGKGSSIHRGCKFFHVEKLRIGENSVVNFGCYFDNRRGIMIGNNVGIAHNTKIYTLGHNIESPEFKAKGAPFVIEDDAFIFSNSLIIPDVTIHRGAIVLAGSVVTQDVEAWTVVGGNPAKVIKERQKKIAYKQKYNYWFAL